jgi:glyoxylase-like metal-dependent hydrolase (beta-lactamase superfamily II)
MSIESHLSVRGFSNTFVISSEGEALIVDPGSFDRRLLGLIEEPGLRVRGVVLTHEHASHTDGLRTMSRIYTFDSYAYYPQAAGFPCTVVREGTRIPFGALEAVCLETPGHSADSVCYRIGDNLFTGDTLMAGEIGSTAGGRERHQILDSIWAKLLCWPEDTLIFPGHGPPTRVEIERRFNPHLALGR